MADVSVRPARPDDVDAVARVQLSTWRTAYADVLPPEALSADLRDVAQAWAAAVDAPPSPRHRVLVAVEGTELVGVAASTPAQDDDLDEATTSELATLAVEPRWGRRGHGSRLLAATVDLWRADGTTTGVAWAWERDAAVRGLLTSAGWALDGTARGLDTGPRVERQVRLHAALEEG